MRRTLDKDDLINELGKAERNHFAARGFHLLLAQDLAKLTRRFRDQHS
jgi:hypothetical protein